jgi:signal transduction histidine kinase
VVPVRRTGRAARRLATGDLTVRVPEEGDDEPVELARAFNAMADSLQESERLKDEFFALVSHELRTPLTSIIGYLELVLDDEDDLSPDARRFLEVVERNAQRLLRLVGDMLFLAQVEAGRLSLESTTVDLERVTADAVEAARPAAERAGVELVLASDPVRAITGDRDRCGQMLDNLISNALKFTPGEGRVEVRLTDGGDRAVVEVADTGTGIPADEQRHLFDRFFRASTATRAAIPGAGLGLTIVKTIVEGHGGTVRLTSREGEGTTVRLELPYDRVEAPA